jgi:Phospholipase_D-nuclease N-terminal
MTALSTIRSFVGRPIVPLLAILALVVAGCAQVGGPSFTFWDVIFSLVALFFWFMLIWIFISVFADIFRRQDLSGLAKAGWVILIVILPFIGALIYIVMRPSDLATGIGGMTSSSAAALTTPVDQEAKRQAADEMMRPPGG